MNEKCIFVTCGNGSCIYNLDTKERMYYFGYYFCAGDEEMFFYDYDKEGIVKIVSDDLTYSYINNTKDIYPCICLDNKLYCNTSTGVICRLNESYEPEVVLAEEGFTYTLLGADDSKIYYLRSDISSKTGKYTICELYSSNYDGTENKKIEIQGLTPDMTCFSGNDKIYLVNYDSMLNIRQVFVYNFGDGSFKTYDNNLISDEDFSIQSEENETDSDISHGNTGENTPKKSASILTKFYTESVDTLTGYTVEVSQDTVPFVVDGNKINTSFYYNIDVEGDYPKEGTINIFIMCDGILQKSSINGGEEKLINQISYKDEEDMCAELEFEIANSSENSSILIGYYISDYIITDDFAEFINYNEHITDKSFSYEMADGYSLDEAVSEKVSAEYNFTDIYTTEENEQYDEVYEFGAVSDTIPVDTQSKRWNIQVAPGDKLYITYYNNAGQYNIYLLVDDMPVALSEENECILFNIAGTSDTVVYEIDADEIFKDGEKHNVKIMVYNRNTGTVQLYEDQIIQMKE